MGNIGPKPTLCFLPPVASPSRHDGASEVAGRELDRAIVTATGPLEEVKSWKEERLENGLLRNKYRSDKRFSPTTGSRMA